MRRRAVLRKIATEARRQGVEWRLVREGANHTVYELGGSMIPIPRHTEFGETFAVAIFQECQSLLGEGMVAKVTTYHADVTRDGKFWFIRVPEIDRATQALRYQDVRTMASELIEVMTGLSSGDYDLELIVRLPGAVEDHLARADVLRAEADRKRAEAAAESRAAVRELIAQGVSQREAGKVLGLSFQRVHQLVHG